jgi:hypothetical protein
MRCAAGQGSKGTGRRARLNPNGIDWPRFVVTTIGDALVGAVQMRRHADGSRELGPRRLVVLRRR